MVVSLARVTGEVRGNVTLRKQQYRIRGKKRGKCGDRQEFYFHGRNKRPPLDNVNEMLSFAYSLLAGMCGTALEAVGLDPYVGFFHTDRL